MRRRRVTEADIECALANETGRRSDLEERSIRIEGPGLDGSCLKVWVVDQLENGKMIVKSTAWKGRSDGEH